MGEIKIVVQVKDGFAVSRSVPKGKVSADNVAMAIAHLELRKKKLIEDFERGSILIDSPGKDKPKKD